MSALRKLFEGVTLRSFIAGIILAILMVAINTFLTLKIGIIEEGYVVCVLLFTLWVMMMKVLKAGWITPVEAVVVGTMGSAGGSLGFLANFFGALYIAGEPLTFWEMTIFAMTTSFVGLVFSIPMRQLFIVTDPLPWPTGKVAISAIKAITAGKEAMSPRVLGLFAALGFGYIFLSAGIGWFPEESLVAAGGLGAYGFGIAWSPFVLGAGYLIGLRVGWGFLIGGLILLAMGMSLPLTNEAGATVMPHKFIWPGVMALTTCGVMQLVLKWKTIATAMKSLGKMGAMNDTDRVVGGRTFVILLVVAFIVASVVLTGFFKVAIQLTIVGLIFGGGFFNIIASRAAGETAFNPVRVMGVLLMAVYAVMGEDSIVILLIAAGLAAGAIGQTGVLTQDIFAGRHFKVPSKLLTILQALVLIPIALAMAWVFNLIVGEFKFPHQATGPDDPGVLAASISVMWHAMGKIFSGQAELPKYALEAMWIGGIGGVVLAVLDHIAGKKISLNPKSWWRLMPHSLGVTLAMVLPIFYDVSFFVGALFLCWVLPKTLKTNDESLNALAAAGIVADGTGNLFVAILKSTGLL